MTIYFHVFPKNGTAKPAMSWEVMELPAIPTEFPIHSSLLNDDLIGPLEAKNTRLIRV